MSEPMPATVESALAPFGRSPEPSTEQRLQIARRELAFETINRLNSFDLLILDDFAYVSKANRTPPSCSRSSALNSGAITANQPSVAGGRSFQTPP